MNGVCRCVELLNIVSNSSAQPGVRAAADLHRFCNLDTTKAKHCRQPQTADTQGEQFLCMIRVFARDVRGSAVKTSSRLMQFGR